MSLLDRARGLIGHALGPQIPELSPSEVRARIDAGEQLVLLDVREPHELMRARLEGAESAPMSTLHARTLELPDDRPVVVLCHHGVRSAWLVRALRQAGHENVYNLSGGIDAWAREVDPGVGRY